MRLAYQFTGLKIKGHIVRHIFLTARPTNFKLGTHMYDDDPHQPQAPWPPRSKVGRRSQGHAISLTRLGSMLYLSLAVGGVIPCRPNPAATLLVKHYFVANQTFTNFVIWYWSLSIQRDLHSLDFVVDLGSSCLGTSLFWVWLHLGPSWPEYDSTWGRLDCHSLRSLVLTYYQRMTDGTPPACI